MTQKIRIIGQNPYRAGSGRAERFGLYKIGMTKDEYLAAGGNANAWERDHASGVIQLEGEPDRDVEQPRRRRAAVPQQRQAPVKAPTKEPHDPNLRYDYDPEECVPITAVSHSEKLTTQLDRYWVFAEGADGSRWRLKQEIFAWGEMDTMKDSVKKVGYIKPRWWDLLKGGAKRVLECPSPVSGDQRAPLNASEQEAGGVSHSLGPRTPLPPLPRAGREP